MSKSASQTINALVDKIDKERIVSALEKLASFTDPAQPGLTRLAYSKTDMQAKNFVAQLMLEAGLDVTVSPVGNTFGALKGPQCDESVVLTGSHTDTVINAGRFDGIIGVICAIEVLRVLQQTKGELLHPIVVVDWTLEEASRFGLCHLGSKVFVGESISDQNLMLQDAQGITLAEALQQVAMLERASYPSNANEDALKAAKKAIDQSRGRPDQIRAYIELHIEQAGSLEEKGCPIGVVTAAAGPTRWSIDIVGEQAHSGSTPMDRRHNALLAAAQIVLTVEQLCQQESANGTVGTITKLTVEPNTMNTVPGQCSLFLDLRSTDSDSKDRVKAQLEQELLKLAAHYKLAITHTVITDEEPVVFSSQIVSTIEKSCQLLDVDHLTVPSRAGHDACTVAGKVAEVGMIFVPSKDGISHHPAESSTADDIVLGAKVLLVSLLDLATSRGE